MVRKSWDIRRKMFIMKPLHSNAIPMRRLWYMIQMLLEVVGLFRLVVCQFP